MDMDVVTRKQLNILIQLAEADKHFAKAERDMIFKIAADRNFPEEKVTELIRNPEPIDGIGALPPEQKYNYLMECIRLIFVDHKVFENELIFCKSIAIKLGFKKNVVQYLVDNYEQIPSEELKNTVLTEYFLP